MFQQYLKEVFCIFDVQYKQVFYKEILVLLLLLFEVSFSKRKIEFIALLEKTLFDGEMWEKQEIAFKWPTAASWFFVDDRTITP